MFCPNKTKVLFNGLDPAYRLRPLRHRFVYVLTHPGYGLSIAETQPMEKCTVCVCSASKLQKTLIALITGDEER